MTVLRSILAVIAGYLIFALSAVLLFHLSGKDPHAPQSVPFMIFAIVYGMCFALLGGVASIRIARMRPVMHAALVAGLIALGATVSLVASPGAGATWSQWGALLLMAPCALLPILLARAQPEA